MYDVENLPSTIDLGPVGKYGVVEIQFDLSAWREDYPALTAAISMTLPSDTTCASPFLLSGVVLSGDTLTWTVGSDAVQEAGLGTIVVRGLVDGAQLRSARTMVNVDVGHGAAGEAPETAADWLSEAATAENARKAAEIVRGNAENARGESEGTRDEQEEARKAAETERAAFYSGFNSSLNGKAPTLHVHATSDVTGLDTALNGKAAKAATPTAGHIATLDANGNPVDGGTALADVTTQLADIDNYTSNLIGSVLEENLYKGSAEWTGVWGNGALWSDAILTHNGFKVKTKTGAWSGLLKLISVVAGETYTFQTWAKVGSAQNVSVMLTSTLSGYVTTATVTRHASQFSVPANTWTKITLVFRCTSSGTVAPRIENTVSAEFSVAEYRLIKGTNPAQLSEVIDDANQLKTIGVYGIGTALSDIAAPNINLLETVTKLANKVYNRGLHTTGDNVNTSIYGLIPINAGQTYYYRMLYAYFTTILYADGSLVSLSNTTESTAYGSFTATMDGLIAITVSNARTNYIFTTSEEMYNKSTVTSYYTPNKLTVPKVYHVESDGTGDFTTLTEAITEACERMDSIIYVGAGTWDLIAELGETYLNSVSTTQRGLVLKNRVHVIFSSRALVTCHYTGSRADTIAWLSPFSAGKYGFTLENARIQDSKCRYSVHDERNSETDHYKNHYINCQMVHDNTDGGYNQCIGGGLGLDGHVIIEGCTFENPHLTNYGIVSFHNSAGAGRSLLEIKDNYFVGTNGMRLAWYGAGTDITTALVHGNSFGREIILAAETVDGTSPNENVELIEWNNDVRV